MRNNPDRASVEQSLALLGVSRETIFRLSKYAALIEQWNPKINLVGPATLGSIWERHFLDSLQLLPLGAGADVWVDVGSGGGFPGLPIALHFADAGKGRVHLVERDARKCAFLREVVRATGAAAEIHHLPIRDFKPEALHVDVVSARALASLPDLLSWTEKMLKGGATGLFPRGPTASAELTSLGNAHRFDLELVPSIASPGFVVRARSTEVAPAESTRTDG